MFDEFSRIFVTKKYISEDKTLKDIPYDRMTGQEFTKSDPKARIYYG